MRCFLSLVALATLAFGSMGDETRVSGVVGQVRFSCGVGEGGKGQLFIDLFQGKDRKQETVTLKVGVDVITLDGEKARPDDLMVALWTRKLHVVAWKKSGLYPTQRVEFVGLESK